MPEIIVFFFKNALLSLALNHIEQRSPNKAKYAYTVRFSEGSAQTGGCHVLWRLDEADWIRVVVETGRVGETVADRRCGGVCDLPYYGRHNFASQVCVLALKQRNTRFQLSRVYRFP